MKLRWSLVISMMSLWFAMLAACAPAPLAGEQTTGPGEPTEAASVPPTGAPEPTPDPFPGWSTYVHPATGLGFRYPSGWFGPEVYDFEGGVRIELGSDTVYPYGTGPDERQPGAPNAYNIVIQYTLNASGWTLEQYRAGQPWLNDSLAVLELQDGESITTARSVTTRQRALTVGRFTGVEFTTTLSDTAQTERFYMRTAFLMDEGLNVLVINGSPSNVQVTDPAAWRAAFESIDAAKLSTFEGLVGSLQVD